MCGLAKKSKGVNGVLSSEAQRVDSGGEVLGEGQLAPSLPLREFGERCKQPRRGNPGRSAIFLYF